MLAAQVQPAVADGLLPVDLQHPSAMVPRLGLLTRLFAWIFFTPVQYPPRLVGDLAGWSKEGALAYVMNTTSQLDYLYFNWAHSHLKLPLAHFANGVTMVPFQPWRRAIAGWLRRRFGKRPQPPEGEVLQGHLRRRNAVLVFLRRAFSLLDLLTARPQVPYLRELIEAQRTVAFPILVVPQVLVWTRNPQRDRTSIIDEFFGDPEAPGRIRKLFSFLLNHRRAFVQLGQPIDLRAFLQDNAQLQDDAVIAERLRAAITEAFETEHRLIRGAPIKAPAQVRDEILAEADVQADVTRLAAETKLPVPAVRTELLANLKEIAAIYKMWMVASFSFILTLVWARIYEGMEVDEEGLDRIREAGRKSPVAIVPSHRSHIDYLVISYIFYRNGLIPPHIAAGANLSFFPMGWIFRRAGAFFLRRSFHGQPIYAAAFRHYVRKLIADGHWLEFFPEGARSRTGKLLPPRFGLIKHVLEAVADGKQEDVAFIPTNFGYERLIEEKAYRRELEGGEKKAESPVDVLKATSVLVHKYGRIRVQFGEPMSVRQLLEEHDALGPDRDPKAFERAVKVCGYAILGGINKAAVITPTALTAAVLLTKVQKGISKTDLLLRVGYLLDVASRRGAVLSDALVTAIRVRRQQIRAAESLDASRQVEAGGVPDPLGEQAERARIVGEAVADIVDKALVLFEKSGWVQRREFEDQTVVIVKKAGRLHLDYYKNNMIHLFVPDALLAASVLALRVGGGPRQGAEEGIEPASLQDLTKFLSRLLKFEFVYAPGVDFEAQYQVTVDDFLAGGWLARDDQGRLRPPYTVVPVLRLYAKLVQNFLESYHLMARCVRRLLQSPATEKAFLDQVQIEAQKAFDLGDVQCYEAISKVNLSNALKIFIEQGFVEAVWEGQGKKRQKLLAARTDAETAARFVDYSSRIEQLHAPWRADRL